MRSTQPPPSDFQFTTPKVQAADTAVTSLFASIVTRCSSGSARQASNFFAMAVMSATLGRLEGSSLAGSAGA